ncbi:MAG: hypothetical protein IT473_15085 [Lysobacter sp.]|nr:hypothetical protein [Lysobacter sp.]
MRIIIATALCLSLAGCATTYRISVWPEKGVPADDATQAQIEAAGLVEHPCGWVREVEVSKLPPPGRPGHVRGSETVAEFDASGTILQRWSLPVDMWPQAIDGAMLVVADNERALTIDTDGRLSATAGMQSEASGVDCPSSVVDAFEQSEFLICVRMTDVSNGGERTIAYEANCT